MKMKPDTKIKIDIKMIRVDSIIPYKNNPRTNDHVVDIVAKSIREFGFKVPMVIDIDNVIVTGHTRLKAAIKLNIKEVPCIIASDLTQDQIKAFRLADNKSAELALWDLDKLEIELSEIDLDMEQFNFDMSEINLDTPGIDEILNNLDNIPKTIESKVKKGDIWQLDNHRIMCGDSTSAKDVNLLMNGEVSEMLFTSPPYSDMRIYSGKENLDLSINHLSKFISIFYDYAKYQVINLGIKRKNHNIISYWDDYINAAKKAGYKFLSWNVWKKTNGAGSLGNQVAFIPIAHEWLFVFGKEMKEINRTWRKKDKNVNKNKTTKTVTMRDENDIVKTHKSIDTPLLNKQMDSVIECSIETGNVSHTHPATFPVALPQNYIEAITDKYDIIIDPFLGSGTTLIASEDVERYCYGMEIDPEYCDVAIARWEQFTGKKAEFIKNTIV